VQYPIHRFLEYILVLFAVIGGLYGAYKIIKPTAMSWIQNKFGVTELYKGQAEIRADVKKAVSKQEAVNIRMLEKLDSVLVQLTINGGSVTVKDDLSSIKKNLNKIHAEIISYISLSPNPTFLNNEDGSCIAVNEALCNLFGATRDEMLGYGWINFLDDSEKNQKADNWKRGIQKDFSITDRYYITNGKTGERIYCEYVATITRDNEGKIMSIMGIVNRIN
jgi:PAS domain S-box-containing protein